MQWRGVKITLLIFCALFLGFLWVDWLFPVRVELPYAQEIHDRNGELLHAFLASDDKWRMKAELSEVSPELVRAIVHKEDRYFYQHPGINPVAIVRALANNLMAGRTTSGASTITMQVARLLDPQPRTYANKLLEMFRALQLEWHYSKAEILALYLNLIPYGSNVEGVKAASFLYLGRPPAQLSLSQAVALAVIPNRPTSLALGRHNGRIRQARDKWLKRLAAEGVFAQERVATALAEPFEAARRDAPQFAPHFAWYARQRWPEAQTIHATLDLQVQAKVEQEVLRYAQFARRYNIDQAAALVIDNRTREVVAYLGSPDFADDAHQGQVNGVVANRSPGSTLKPFVYGMAFDEGLLTPRTVLTDVPLDLGGYSPENFDQQFHGEVTVEEALSASLNTVAVKVLRELGVRAFVEKLSRAGFQSIQRRSRHLGLSLALGGCGTSLQELAAAYAALANSGQWQPLRFRTDQPLAEHPYELLSPAASYVITEILSKIERPDFPNNYQYNPAAPKLAWKTGTSYGRRDAWSIGYNPRYTIAVWLGNFDNRGARQLTGSGMATPLLFKLFHLLDRGADGGWFSPPKSLDFRLVCAKSGQLPEAFCDHQLTDWYLPGISPATRCTHLKYCWVSPDAQISYCATCLPRVGYRQQLYPNHSPELLQYFQAERLPFEAIPPHNPDCPSVLSNDPPRITSPAADRAYGLIGESTQLSLEAQAANDASYLHWYVNDRYLDRVPVGQPLFFTPPKGRVRISCTDDRGRHGQISILVE